MAVLSRPRPEIIRLRIRDIGWSCVVRAAATATCTTSILATTPRPGERLLRGDHALGCPGRSPGHSTPAQIAPCHRSLHLAHLPDELSGETDSSSMEESGGPIRRRLHSAARLPSQSVETPRSRPWHLPDRSNLPDRHRSPPLPFSTPCASSIAQARSARRQAAPDSHSEGGNTALRSHPHPFGWCICAADFVRFSSLKRHLVPIAGFHCEAGQ